MQTTYYNLKKLNTKALSVIEMAVIIFLSAYYILPAVNNMLSTYIEIFMAIAFIMYVFIKDSKELSFIVAFLTIAAWIALMYALLTDSSSIHTAADNYVFLRFVSKFYQQLIMFLPCFITLIVAKQASYKQKRLLLFIVGIMIVYVMIVTMRELTINPEITRKWEDFDETSKDNIASYYFVYAVPILVGMIVILFMRSKKIYFKLLSVALLIFSFVFLVQAQYTLALLIAVIGLLMGFLKGEKSAIVKTIGVFLTVVVLIFTPDILEFVASNLKNGHMKVRLGELADFFGNGDATGYNLNGRFTLYWETIKAFFASPLWGNRSLDFDGHATFLTVLADIGILGGVPFYFMYFMMKNKIIKVISDSDKLFIVPFIMLFIMGLTNPIHAAFPVGFSVWFVVPLLIMVLNDNSVKTELRGVENE